MTTYYFDPIGGSDAADGLSFANRKKLLSAVGATFFAAGDIARVMACPGGSVGNADWTNGSDTLTLAAAKTLTLNNCDATTGWVASANVTMTTNTNRRQGSNSLNFTFASGFTTGIVAYLDLGAATDLSAYQQISLLMMPTSVSTITNGRFSLRLCSDAVGAVAVHTFAIPPLTQLANGWCAVVLDNAGALNNAIRSISIVANNDPGTTTFRIDNIIACKSATGSDTITHRSLLCKNGGTAPHNDVYYPIRSIDGTSIILETERFAETAGASGRGYYGTTETCDTRVLNPYDEQLNSTGLNWNNSLYGNPCTMSGGWDRTNMSSQGTGRGDYSVYGKTDHTTPVVGPSNNMTGIIFSRIGCYTYQAGFNFSPPALMYVEMNNCLAIGSSPMLFNSNAFLGVHALNNVIVTAQQQSSAVQFNSGNIIKGSGLRVYGGGNAGGSGKGIELNGSVIVDYLTAEVYNTQGDGVGPATAVTDINFKSLIVEACSAYGISGFTSALGRPSTIRIHSGSSTGNGTAVVRPGDSLIYMRNFSFTEANFLAASPFTLGSMGQIEIKDYDDVADDHRTYNARGSWQSETSVRHTASGIAWKMSPILSTTMYATSFNPLRMPIARIACDSGVAVTATVWLRRTHANLSGRFILRGGQIAGVASDVYDDITAAADTWEQMSITFTPTEKGVVELEVECYAPISTTYSLYVDDLEITV